MGVESRAGELKRYIERHVPTGPVHLIGHSMGGLDARFMISRLGMRDRVLSLTTVGTPHRGSPFADWGVRRFGRLAAPFFQLVGLSYQAFLDVTTAACRRFNATVPDAPGVRYFSVAGACEGRWVCPEWRVPHGIVSEAVYPRVSRDCDGLPLRVLYYDGTRADKGDVASVVHRVSLVVRALMARLRAARTVSRRGSSSFAVTSSAAKMNGSSAAQPISMAMPMPMAGGIANRSAT